MQDIEAYSAFEGYLTDAIHPSDPPDIPSSEPLPEARDSELARHLRQAGVNKVVIVGVATDFWLASFPFAVILSFCYTS